jgi:hypothetical protein
MSAITAVQIQPVEITLDRILSIESVIDLVNAEENRSLFVPFSFERRPLSCSFCKCTWHNILSCSHPDIERLHRSAMFMYLTTCRYLKTHPNTEKTHELWLDHLSTSEYRILAKLIRLDTNSRTTRGEYQEKLHAYYIQYAENELRNDPSTNAKTILEMYLHPNNNLLSNLLSGIVTNENAMRFAIYKLNMIIKNSGRYLIDMNRIRYWLNNHMNSYVGLPYQPRVVLKKIPTITHKPCLAKETHDECPICYTEMTNETLVQLGCCHSFCGDCIIGQIKSSNKTTSACAMCRCTISECSSASEKLLEKITTSIK